MSYSVTKNGIPLDPSLYTFNEETRTFSSKEDDLVLDFSLISGCTFKTGSGCTFNTNSYCTFKTSFDCTFDTGSDCTFDTSYDCTFKTGSGCVVIRRDIYEVIELTEWIKIKLNEYCVKWFTKYIPEYTLEQLKTKIWEDFILI